jgi:glycosyltransferase involved in cell wall biosynthesis
MLKIAIWHNLPSGGGKRALYYFVRGLTERGHQLACWSLDTADHSYLPLSDFAPERIISSDCQGRSRQTVSAKWRSDFNQTVDRMKAFDEACRRCAHEIEAGDFDLLFATGARLYSVPYIMRHLRMKKVLYLQEPCRYLYEARPILPWVANAPENLEHAHLLRPRRFIADYPLLQSLRLQAKQEWLNLRSCDQVLVNSYFSRESFLRAYGVDAKVCYLGVDTTLFRDLGLSRERVVVGLGSFDSIKGVDLAVRALALLPEPRPTLVWIANSRDEAYLNATIELALSLGVELRIQMSISDVELVTILNKASLLLYTSRLEPFGFAPLEANACGLPVVGIAEGGIRETVQDGINGFLVDPEASCIARAAGELLQNPSLARQMGKRAVVNVERNWNLESSINRLEKILLRAAATEARKEH